MLWSNQMPIGKARLKISEYREHRKYAIKRREKGIRLVSLSLTSMVDMFAILVIFLLSSSGTVSEWLGLSQKIKLPEARYNEPPKKEITIQLANDILYIDDLAFQNVSALTHNKIQFEKLTEYLKQKSDQHRLINLACDEHLPYGIVRNLIKSFKSAGFSLVNLATTPIAEHL